jgi:tetratricopeptide (TPR) repeat protein
MNLPRFFLLLAGCAAFALRAEPSSAPLTEAQPPEAAPATEAPPEDPRQVAKREAWTSVVLIVSLLEEGDNQAFPGIRAWLEDFRHTAASTPAPAAGQPFPHLDSDALVTRNPNFWGAYFEVLPGDPGLALLHSALLLSGGEAQRAAILASFGLQRAGIPEEIKRGLNAVITHCQAAQARSAVLVRAGTMMADAHDFEAALKKYDEALAEWPANGWAYYERGSALRMRALAAARRLREGREAEIPPDPPEVLECFARARQHDPLHLLSYQGEDPAILAALMPLVRAGMPVLEAIHRHPEQPVKRDQLHMLSETCREARIDEFALPLRQLTVSGNRRYSPDDQQFIAECLSRLAPAALRGPVLARIKNEGRLATRQIVLPAAPEPPEPPEPLLAKAEEPPPKEAKKPEPEAKPKGKGKTAKAKTAEPKSKKAKRKIADMDDPPPKSKRQNNGDDPPPKAKHKGGDNDPPAKAKPKSKKRKS